MHAVLQKNVEHKNCHGSSTLFTTSTNSSNIKRWFAWIGPVLKKRALRRAYYFGVLSTIKQAESCLNINFCIGEIYLRYWGACSKCTLRGRSRKGSPSSSLQHHFVGHKIHRFSRMDQKCFTLSSQVKVWKFCIR